MGYLETAAQVYAEAAVTPQAGLCCVSTPPLQLPGLQIPEVMQAMNYGCGTTVHPTELSGEPRILYIGVGGGLEALQFAYFCRQPGQVVAVEPVAEMRAAAGRNLHLAAELNPWFSPEFVTVLPGDALDLPVETASVDLVAQNCLFNIFQPQDLRRALDEAHRVLKPGGRLYMSDPIATQPIPIHLQEDERLRALCLSGALTYEAYVQQVVDAGFGQIEVRARRPYRVLDSLSYGLDQPLRLDSLDTVAYKVPIPADGACVFTGKTATYVGVKPYFDDQAGHRLERGLPAAICDKTARNLARQYADQVMITESTWHYQGGGCC
ncbi:MAG: arsenosugar biosynthesis arsenite methyltransferase ArsM [Gloeomargaritaceae cyanobacterium C42_A2020_066]|nr:arsenosugar biosynthesis arsenite methyltransferase ArsM [Gloeomargaritaceae cyanobacterium C42_A2020_066]